jgi:hypothetical protein
MEGSCAEPIRYQSWYRNYHIRYWVVDEGNKEEIEDDSGADSGEAEKERQDEEVEDWVVV